METCIIYIDEYKMDKVFLFTGHVFNDSFMLYGHTENSEPVAIRITDYESIFYIALPLGTSRKKIDYEDSETADQAIYDIKIGLEECSDYSAELFEFKIVKKIEYYYYSEPVHYLEVLCKKPSLEKKIEGWLKKTPIKIFGNMITLKCWHTTATIAADTKFYSLLGITRIECIRVNAPLTSQPITNLKYEYECMRDDIEIVHNYTKVPKPVTLSFDIETKASKGGAPKSGNTDDTVEMLTAIVQYPDDSTKTYLFALQTFEYDGPVICKFFDDEIDMLDAFFELIRDEDPDCITGYNIIGYDFGYITDRYAIIGAKPPQAGRILDIDVKIVEESWSSSQVKNNVYTFPEMYGRVVADLFPIVKVNFQLKQYNLNTVAKHFTGEAKVDLDYITMNKIFLSRDPIEMSKVAVYCIQDSFLVVKLFNKLNIWFWIRETSGTLCYDMNYVMYTGQQKKSVSQLYTTAMKINFILTMRQAVNQMKFVGGFVGEPIIGYHDGVSCLDFNSLYPNIMIKNGICPSSFIPITQRHKYRREDMTVINVPVDMGRIREMERNARKTREMYSGFKDSYYDTDEENDSDAEEETGVIEMVEFAFIKESVRQGILPMILENLLSARKEIRARIKVLENEYKTTNNKDLLVMIMVLDRRQNAVKISANSMYGFIGAQKTGKFSFIEGAVSVTATGRLYINRINDLVVNHYGCEVIYNDTDSTFIKHPNMPRDQLCDRAEMIAANVISLDPSIPKGMKIEHEKTMDMILFTKKKYAGRVIAKDGSYERTKTGEIKMIVRGIVTARRDTFIGVSQIFNKLMDCILDGRPAVDAYELVFDYVRNFKSRELSDFVLVKQLGSNYVNENTPINVYAQYLRSKDVIVNAGERLEYVVAAGDAGRTGERMRPPKSINDGTEMVDYHYYMELSKNPIRDILTVGYPGVATNRYYDYKSKSFIKGETGITLANVIRWSIKLMQSDEDIYDIYEVIGNHIRRICKPKN